MRRVLACRMKGNAAANSACIQCSTVPEAQDVGWLGFGQAEPEQAYGRGVEEALPRRRAPFFKPFQQVRPEVGKIVGFVEQGRKLVG